MLDRPDEGIEETGLRRSFGGETAVFEKSGERGFGLLARDAVDRIGVIAGRDQQPLDSGKPRLLVVVIGLLGDIGRRALFALRGLNRREAHEALAFAGGAGARARDHEIAVGDAQLPMRRLGRR